LPKRTVERLLAAVSSLGFQIVGPEKRHERRCVNRLDVLGKRNQAIFAKRISYTSDSSKAMWKPYYLIN
jgi:hypothetical protein